MQKDNCINCNKTYNEDKLFYCRFYMYPLCKICFEHPSNTNKTIYYPNYYYPNI